MRTIKKVSIRRLGSTSNYSNYSRWSLHVTFMDNITVYEPIVDHKRCALLNSQEAEEAAEAMLDEQYPSWRVDLTGVG